MLAETRLMTAEEFESLPFGNMRTELVRGEVSSMSPAGHLHGRIALKLGTYLNLFVIENKLGEAYAAETGFVLQRDPDTVRAPDLAFVTAERAQAQTRDTGFFDGAPDLAVEVISPHETAESIEDKLIDYLEAGTQQVWLVYPRTQTVIVYNSLTEVTAFSTSDTHEGGDLLPGFQLPVRNIFR